MLTINKFTGIENRSFIADIDHYSVNDSLPAPMEVLNDLFFEYAVPLSVEACENAIAEWGGSKDEITHMVSTTCGFGTCRSQAIAD